MAIVGIVLFALLLLAVPIGIALSSAAAAYIMVDPLLETTVIFRQFFSFIGRCVLLGGGSGQGKILALEKVMLIDRRSAAQSIRPERKIYRLQDRRFSRIVVAD